MKARDNPFATSRVETLLPFDPIWFGTSWEGILSALRSSNYRGSIVGPHGSGKTTFLDALVPRLREEGLAIQRYFLNDQRTAKITTASAPDVLVLIDGAERLGFREWRRIRDHPRLLITQHREARLPALLRTRSTPEMLEHFARQLDPSLAFDAPRLHRKHRGNLREALLECYDLVSQSDLRRGISPLALRA